MVIKSIVAATILAQTAAPSSGPLLWREFRQGMTPEEYTARLRKTDGVKSVDLSHKAGKPAKIKTVYVNGKGVVIGNMTVSVSPVFEDDALASMSLSETGCQSAVTAVLPATISALTDKYPVKKRVRVVDGKGVLIDIQQAFNNDETRVTVSITQIANPYPQHLYGGTGLVAVLNKVANDTADGNYNAAIEACPADSGRKATLTLEYMSQSRFASANEKDVSERKAKDDAMKAGL